MSTRNYIHPTETAINVPEAIDNDSQLIFNIEIELDTLEELILNSTHVPLTQLAIVERDLLLRQLEQIKENLSLDFAMAIEIANCKQQIIAEAENYASLLVKSAEEKVSKMLQESAIVRQAELDGAKARLKTERECQELIEATQNKVAQMRQNAIAECVSIQTGADSYADGVLGDIEQRLQQMLKIIQNGRQQLDVEVKG